MIILFRQLRTLLKHTPTWVEILIGFGALYLAALLMFNVAGEAELSNPWTCFWWFVVTITTVGYGDFSPTTVLGETAALSILIFGVALTAALLGDAASKLIDKRMKAMNGLASFDYTDHIVVLGYEPDFTRDLLSEILGDPKWADTKIILVTDDVESNPHPELCCFVRGATDSEDVAARSNIGEASHVIVHGHSDSESIRSTLMADAEAPEARILVYLEKESARRHISRINTDITVVTAVSSHLLVQELQDPGVTQLIGQMMSNAGQTLFKIPVPHSGTFIADWRDQLIRDHGALLIATETSGRVLTNPSDDHMPREGDGLYVIANEQPQLKQAIAA